MQTSSILGIDAGNSRMKMAGCDPLGNPVLLHNRDGEPFTPSVVYFAPEGGIIVGTEALNAGYADPKRAIFNWKRYMGTDTILYVDERGKQYRAEDIEEILLKHQKDCYVAKFGQEPEDVMISVPANFTDPQKEATLRAAKNAGLNASQVVHEPTAAGLGNNLHKRAGSRFLIYDLGGGTFDVSIIEVAGQDFNVITTTGEPHLGGQDINAVILEIVLDKFEAEHGFRPHPHKHPLFFMEAGNRIESMKIALSTRTEARLAVTCDGHLLNMTLTRSEFDKAVQPLVDKSMACVEQAMKDANLNISQIDGILLVGGASKMPIISSEIEKRFGKKPEAGVEPDYAAAFGNVVAGRMKREREGRPLIIGGVALPPSDRRYSDVTAYSIGVSALDDEDRLRNVLLLEKGVPMPSEQVRLFKLATPLQTQAMVEILQGVDGMMREKCTLLGHFELTGLPPQQEKTPRIEIRMRIDANGMLTANARDTVSGKTAELVIDYKNHKGNGQGDGSGKAA